MTKQYKKMTLSLRSLADLIKLSGKKLKVEFSVLEADLERISDLETENEKFTKSLEEFEANTNLLLDQLEELKIYAEKLEFQTAGKFNGLIQLCAQYHLFNLLPIAGESSEEKLYVSEIYIKLNEIIREVTKRLNEQVKIEKRLFKGKPLRGYFWTELVNSDKRLTKLEKHSGSLLEELGDEEIDAYEGVKKALQHIVNSDGRISHEDFQLAVNVVLEFLSVVEEEFDELFSVESHSEIQQSHLFEELDELAKEKIDASPNQMNSKLKLRTAILSKILSRYNNLVHRDWIEAKKMRRTVISGLNDSAEATK